MPVFDFNNAPDDKKPVVCTYTTFSTNEDHASIENPILVLDNSKKEWNHHSCGIFTNQSKQTAFEFDEDGGTISADILLVDARFVSLLKWLGEIISMCVYQERIQKADMPCIVSGRSHLVAVRSCLRRMDSCSL